MRILAPCLLWLALSCNERSSDPGGALPPAGIGSSRSTPAPTPTRAPESPVPPATPSHASGKKPAPADPFPERVLAPPVTDGRFIVDDLVDVAPAGPATAHDLGIILVDKENQVFVAPREQLSQAQKPVPTRVRTLDRPRSSFAPYGRGPAVVGPHAYWVERGRLLRRRLDGTGELDVLANDARSSTRVSGARLPGKKAMVAYITAPDEAGSARAKLWIEGGKIQVLTPDGAAASSIALVPQGGALLSVALDGRTGMTPLHARRVTPTDSGATLGPDVVAWVGASAQSTTEVTATIRGDDAWAFVAIDRDITHFGLAQIDLGPTPNMNGKPSFVPFPNGANTVPVAAAELCEGVGVVFARPSGPEPGVPQELVLAELGPQGLFDGVVVVRSKAFSDASLASVDGGALLAYTADHRTWAASIRCRKKSKKKR